MNFNYKNKNYNVEDVTIEMWSKLIALQEWTDEREFSIKLLSFATGLTEEEIENSDFQEVIQISNDLSKHFLKDGNQFHKEFEFEGKKYKFLDLANLTFGEFVDIDTFLAREPHEKKREMNLLMAMLYREVDEKGNYLPYNSKEIQPKAELFKKLPVKYLNGASNFFFHLDKTLSGNFRGSLWLNLKLMIKMIWILVKFTLLTSIGLGLVQLSNWRKKILQKSKR